MYDIIVSLDTGNPDPTKRTKVISLRIEAANAAEAKMLASKKINDMGYGQHTRSGFSCRDAR